MGLTLYEYVYIAMEIISTFCIYRLMRALFQTNGVNRYKEIISYIMYDVLITMVYLFVNVPLAMILCSIVGLTVLSMNYKERMKKRVLLIAFIEFILFTAEAIIGVISGYINISLLDVNDYSSILGIISLQIVLYAVTVFVQKFKNLRNGVSIPMMYWVGLFTIPTTSIFIIIVLFYATGLSTAQMLACDLFLLWININAFTLYDSVLASAAAQAEKKLLVQQNNYYEKQFEIMQTAEKSMHSIKHDWLNHLSVMQELLVENNVEALQKYLKETEEHITEYNKVINSGNSILDSILNFKMKEAQQNDIKFHAYVTSPETIGVTPFDLTVVIGNLLDNAIQASIQIEPNERDISVDIRYKIGILTIEVKNRYNGSVLYEGDSISTSKNDKANHGYGIANIRKVVDKYSGYFNIEHYDKIFISSVMLRMNKALSH